MMESYDPMALPPYLESSLGLENGHANEEIMGGFGPG